MSLEEIKAGFNEARDVLDRFINNPDNWTKFEIAGSLMVDAIKNNHKIISCGNGGSMCDAMHFAEELTGSFREKRQALPAISISDSSHITCSTNDFGYGTAFSRYIEALGQEGDVLLAISTSGKSPNVIAATKAAKAKGMKVVGLTGKTGGELADIVDVELRVPHNGYSDRIQEIHIKIIHSLIQYIEMHVC